MIRYGSAIAIPKTDKSQCNCGQGPESGFHLVFCNMFGELGGQPVHDVHFEAREALQSLTAAGGMYSSLGHHS